MGTSGMLCRVAFALLSVLATPAVAADPAPSVFCDSAGKIDRVIEMIGQGASLDDAVAALEGCTRADRVVWLVVGPQPLASARHDGRLRYRAMLIGMVVRGEVTSVVPPAPVYFFSTRPYDGASTGA
jgi:hypothetical protein